MIESRLMKIFFFIFQLIISILTPLYASGFQNINQEDLNQENLNRWVAKEGAKIYFYLNNSGRFDYPIKNTTSSYYTKSEYWEPFSLIMSPIVSFIKKRGTPASIALKSLLESEGRFDCRIAQKIIFHSCILKLIGEKNFNEINQKFEETFSMPSMDGYPRGILFLDGPQSLNPYMDFTFQEKSSLYCCGKIGYFGYTPNIKEYERLHFEGSLRGDHGLLCSDDDEEIQLYAGYGEFYKQGAQPWHEVMLRFKQETLSISPAIEKLIDTSKISDSSREVYIRHKSELNKKIQKDKEILVKSLKESYENKFQSRQKEFEGSVFFINLEKIKSMLVSVTLSRR